MAEKLYISRIARKAWEMTRADVGITSLRTTIVKLVWVAVALGIMYAFEWHKIAADRTSEVFAGVLAFIAIFVLLYVFNFFSAPAVVQRETDETVESLKKQILDREKRQAAVSRMWELRKEGVQHRNTVIEEIEYPIWLQGLNEWRARVFSEAENISVNFSSWLSTLDRVRPPPRLSPPVSDEHDRERKNMSEILLRMQEFLEADMLDRDIRRIKE